MSRRLLALTEGLSDPHRGKVARNLLKYKPEEVVAVFDRENAGKRAVELFGFGEDVPVVGSLEEAPEANAIVVGVAVPGGVMPESYVEIVREAILRRMDAISGLHDFLSGYPRLVEAAEQSGVRLIDLRKTMTRRVVSRAGIDERCYRVLTVGNDCSVGKMVVSLEATRELIRRGYDAKFAPTGQTGMLVEGEGEPIDAIPGDFIAGAVEGLVLRNQTHKILLVEGQASLVHPRYSGVTLGLLHGATPDALVMCYELGRERVHGVESMTIPPLADVIDLHERLTNVMRPTETVALAINGRKAAPEEIDAERERARREYGLPAADVMRHGVGEIVDAILERGVRIGKIPPR
jgi:uncharacterized NAD-dependent epimerase/dehydratase family protein